MSVPNIVVVGSYAAGLTIKASRFPSPGETVEGFGFASFHGGKGSNQAVECARQGARTSLIAYIGDDLYGKQAMELFRREGVQTDMIRVASGQPTGVGLITVDDTGENEIVIDFGANNLLSPSDIEKWEDAISEADAVLMQMEIPVNTIHAALETAKKHNVLSILNPAPYRPLSPQDIALASIVTPNETEAKLMLGMSSREAVAPETLGHALELAGVGRSAITLGKRGVLVTENGRSEVVDAFSVQTTDTTGAGDTFSAALATAVSEGATLKEAARFAAAAAALSVTRYGVIEAMPTRKETLDFLHMQG